MIVQNSKKLRLPCEPTYLSLWPLWYFNVKWRFLRLTLFFFFKKVWLFQIKAVPLDHQNPPSLSTMLNRRQTESNVKLVWTLPRCEGGRDCLKFKCSGRFILIQWVTESHSRSRTPVRTILSVSCSQEVWQLQIRQIEKRTAKLVSINISCGF